jgi:hypothetical protein
LECSVGTVKSRILRGRRALKEILEPMLGHRESAASVRSAHERNLGRNAATADAHANSGPNSHSDPASNSGPASHSGMTPQSATGELP